MKREIKGKRILILGSLLTLSLVGFIGYKVLIDLRSPKYPAAVLPGVLNTLTNLERSKVGEAELKENPLLTQAAQAKANDMAKNNYFAHVSPDGKTPWYWFNKAGYQYLYAGENLAVHYSESGFVTQAWMNSVTHRANIMKQNYTEIGTAVATGTWRGVESVFVVQLYASPLSTTTSPL